MPLKKHLRKENVNNMYNPKEIFTENGLEDYLTHIRNIQNGLCYIKEYMDDLHIGALDTTQANDFFDIYNKFEKLVPLLKKGDGEQI